MAASGVVGETGTGGPGQAEPSVPAADRIEGGVSGERMVLFTDAVTAISITLLILPLVDLVPEAASAHEDAREVITGHLDQIWSFLLSFAVIANIWREHHRTFSSVTEFTRSLTVWNMGWLLSPADHWNGHRPEAVHQAGPISTPPAHTQEGASMHRREFRSRRMGRNRWRHSLPPPCPRCRSPRRAGIL